MQGRSRSRFARFLALVAFVGVIWTGCNDNINQPTVGEEATTSNQEVLDVNHPSVRNLIAVQEKYTANLMQANNIVGTAIGLDDNGEVVLKVYTTEAVSKGGLPLDLDGVRVVQEVTGRFVAMKGRPGGGGGGGGGGVDHKALQATPIKLGTSGGWRDDLANGYCCGGTLGALVNIGSQQHVMSNYHVLEADIVNGGNGTTAKTGDFVIQPALIDVGCNAGSTQNVATLVVKNALPGNNVDVAVAKVISGQVASDGEILEVGTISSSTVGASLSQNVKKSGRTTGLTRSRITGLNATISVSYENECAGGTAFTKTFTGQIVVRNKGSKFLAGGDSGSLMVEDVSNNPRAVGLLYAGSSSTAIANPIGDVLSFLNATLVGN